MSSVSDGVADALESLVERFPAAWYEDANDVAAGLRDTAPSGSAREIAVLVEAARAGVPKRLLSMRGTPLTVTCAVVAQRWASSSSIDPVLAGWAVETWARALGLGSKTGNTSSDKTVPVDDLTPPDPITDKQEPKKHEVRKPARGSADNTEGPAARPFWKRRRNLIAIAVLALMVAVGGILPAIRNNQERADLSAGNAARDNHKWAEAHDAYQKTLALDPNSAAAWYGDGIVLRALKKYDDAATALEHATTLDPTNEDGFVQYGYVLDLLSPSRYDESIAAYEKALSINPKDGLAMGNLSYEQFNDKQYKAALATAKKATALMPALPTAWAIECKSAYYLDDPVEHQSCLTATLQAKTSDDAYLWEARGWSILSANVSSEMPQARAAFATSVGLNHNSVEAIRGLAVADIHLGYNEEAFEKLDAALKFYPNNASLWNDQGVALNNLGRYSEALASYRHALKLRPVFPTATSNIKKLLHAFPYLQ